MEQGLVAAGKYFLVIFSPIYEKKRQKKDPSRDLLLPNMTTSNTTASNNMTTTTSTQSNKGTLSESAKDALILFQIERMKELFARHIQQLI